MISAERHGPRNLSTLLTRMGLVFGFAVASFIPDLAMGKEGKAEQTPSTSGSDAGPQSELGMPIAALPGGGTSPGGPPLPGGPQGNLPPTGGPPGGPQ